MSEPAPHPSPWLIAAWPGMGNVAVIVAGYLIRQLDMKQIGELPPGDHFDVAEVEVKDGIIAPVHVPRGMFFRWTNPRRGRDLIVFLGEAQPSSGNYRYSQKLMEAAGELGADRVVTFASMASALHPAKDPKVTGVANDAAMLEELRKAEVQAVGEGQIGGLNGLVLAAAAERGIPGFCLLAEIPFFAAGVPNPKAARAALSVFTVLTGIDVSLDELNRHADAVDRALIDAYERMNEEERQEGEESDESAGERPQAEIEAPPETPRAEEPAAPATPQPPAPPSPQGAALDPAARRRIEQLFEAARQQRSAAVPLKVELDRLGVFREYENRFLDLFRRAN